MTVTLAPGEQRIIPEAVDFLRERGAAVGPAGAAQYGGALRITVSGRRPPSVFAGARTASPSRRRRTVRPLHAGRPRGQEAATDAAALRPARRRGEPDERRGREHGETDGAARSTCRSRPTTATPAALPKGAAVVKSLAPGQWAQLDDFLAAAASRTAGWSAGRPAPLPGSRTASSTTAAGPGENRRRRLRPDDEVSAARPGEPRREPLFLLLAALAVMVWSGIAPKDRFTWWLEVAPVLIGAPLLVATARRFPLTPLLYRLLFLHAAILMVGGHYTYAEVPLGFWVRDAFDLAREPLRPDRPLRAGLRPGHPGARDSPPAHAAAPGRLALLRRDSSASRSAPSTS